MWSYVHARMSESEILYANMCAFWLLLLVCPYSTSHLRHSLSFESTICPSHQIIVYVVCIYNPVLCMKNISSNKREGRRFLKNTSFRIMCCERSNQMARDTVNPIRNVFDSIVQISSTIYVCVVIVSYSKRYLRSIGWNDLVQKLSALSFACPHTTAAAITIACKSESISIISITEMNRMNLKHQSQHQ